MTRRRRTRGYSEARGRISNGDWICGVGECAADGTFTAGPVYGIPTVCGPSYAGTKHVHLVQIPTYSVGLNTTPPIGELFIAGTAGEISLSLMYTGSSQPVTPQQCNIAVGLYVSEQNNNTGKWSTVDPALSNDAQRDDWFYLRNWSMDNVVATNPFCYSFPITVPVKTRLGTGQALALALSCISIDGSSTLALVPALRTLIRRVA